jgi:hypothetical protein
MSGSKLLGSRGARRLLILLGWVVVLGALWVKRPIVHEAGFPVVGSQEFVVYWSAVQLLRGGENPYDAAALWNIVESTGGVVYGGQLKYPPWMLVLLLPLAPLSFSTATMLWLAVQLVLLLGSGLLLWRYFAPADGRIWVGPLLAVAFAPGIFALRNGQITPWLLVGIVGFLWGTRMRREALAGAALALLTIKPHVAYMFWLAALWWAWQGRRWRVFVAWLGTLVVASGVVTLFAPDLFVNYSAALTSPPIDWATATLGAWLRFFFGLDRYWLQFLPSLAGLVGLGIWLWGRRGPWHWEKIMSPLLLASAVTAAFGWSYDQVVLLPVVVDLVALLRTASLARNIIVLSALALSQLGLWMLNQLGLNEVFYVWHAPALAAIYGFGARGLAVEEQRANGQ